MSRALEKHRTCFSSLTSESKSLLISKPSRQSDKASTSMRARAIVTSSRTTPGQPCAERNTRRDSSAARASRSWTGWLMAGILPGMMPFDAKNRKAPYVIDLGEPGDRSSIPLTTRSQPGRPCTRSRRGALHRQPASFRSDQGCDSGGTKDRWCCQYWQPSARLDTWFEHTAGTGRGVSVGRHGRGPSPPRQRTGGGRPALEDVDDAGTAGFVGFRYWIKVVGPPGSPPSPQRLK